MSESIPIRRAHDLCVGHPQSCPIGSILGLNGATIQRAVGSLALVVGVLTYPGHYTSAEGMATQSIRPEIAAMLAQPEIQAASPSLFVLTPENSAVRRALVEVMEPKRAGLARAIRSNHALHHAFSHWKALSASRRAEALQTLIRVQAREMGYPPPSILWVNAIKASADAVLELTQPQPKKAEEGSNTRLVLRLALLQQQEPMPVVYTVVHEGAHALQLAFCQRDRAGHFPSDSPEHVLASALTATQGKGWHFLAHYGDYAHLVNEFDAMQTGNKVVSVVFGQARPEAEGYIDTQYHPDGLPKVDLARLEREVGAEHLMRAVNARQATIWMRAWYPDEAKAEPLPTDAK